MKESSGHIAADKSRGSALILTVVLTSLLAIVGVLFVMGMRIDKMATTAATESRELTCAVDTVLTRIDQVLAEDVPGVTKNQEYYDYPDDLNPWLADLEPYESNGKHYWRQISNLDGILTTGAKNIAINKVLGERDAIVTSNTTADDPDVLADADGDGVPDAKWFRVPGVMTSKGKRFYAAVRIIDNGGMLNMNTGLAFDPSDSTSSGVDPTSPLRVNVLALAAGVGAAPSSTDENKLLGTRANGAVGSAAARDMASYERSVIWRYLDVENPNYTPFDMSDELELRYRYLLDQTEIDTRVETCGLFTGASVPVNRQLDKWFPRVTGENDYATYGYRHVATTYNMDRIITPEPVDPCYAGAKLKKMVNVNTTDVRTLWDAVKAALLESQPHRDRETLRQEAAQISVNIMDYIDDDDEVTVIDDLSSTYLGFERPCVYISEIACRMVEDSTGKHFSYAIELFKPYFEDKDPRSDEWQLMIDNTNIPDVELSVVWSGSRRFHVLLSDDGKAPLGVIDYMAFTDANEPADTMPLYAYNRADYKGQPQTVKTDGLKFEAGATITLKRVVPGISRKLSIDMVRVPEGWMPTADGAYSLRRDITPYRCVRRLWASAAQRSTPTLGNDATPYVDRDHPGLIQAHPANKPLVNIGELGKIFRTDGYIIPEGALAGSVLIDLVDPNNAGLFKYLTVIDPSKQPNSAGTETRIMGRVNINTAPAFVLAQLPWMSYRGVQNATAAGAVKSAGTSSGTPNGAFNNQTALERGREIVKYRDARGPFKSTVDLMRVNTLRELDSDKVANSRTDPAGGPDLTPDTALDDLEERDLLFTRLSDLVTVRSDVFTAYLLVRIGEAGPQKRLIAIFDRSRVKSAGDKARLVALQPVPDPR
ncbi:MAG: hypothetical protein ABFE01_18680 [Phycisphaerales bacterium]